MKGKISKIKNMEDELVLPVTTVEAIYMEDGITKLSDEMKDVLKYEEFDNESVTTEIPSVKEEINGIKKNISEINSSLDKKANLNDTYLKNDVYNKSQVDNKVFSMANMGQDIKEAMTGGSVAVVGENSVNTVNVRNSAITDAKRTHLGEYCCFFPSYGNGKINIDFTNKQITIPNGHLMHRGLRYDISETNIKYDTSISSVQCLVYNYDLRGFTCRPISSSTNSYSGQFDITICYFIDGVNFVYGIGNIFSVNDKAPNNFKNIAHDTTPLILFVNNYNKQIILNSTDKSITIGSACIFFREKRIDITDKTYSIIDENPTSIKGLVLNSKTQEITFKSLSVGVEENEVILLAWKIGTSSLSFNGLIEYYEIDGKVYDFRKKYDTYYVATNGRDTNDGLTKETPLASFQKAIEKGAKNIIAKSGTYWVKSSGNILNVKDYDELNIYMDLDGVSDGACIWIRGENGLGGLVENSDGLLTQEFPLTSGSRYHKVFITKELTPIDKGDRTDGTNACLWESYSDYSKDTKMIPVLSLSECKSTKGSFYCDGVNIYINPSKNKDNSTVYRESRVDGSIFNFENINKLTLHNIKCTHSHETVCKINNVKQYTLHNCEFSYSALGEGIRPYRANGNAYKCIANKNRNDGFNIQTYGDTHFFDCVGMYNYDDGISHHTGCTGSIVGGEYAYNGKGGVAPAHGAEVDVYNVISHHNAYGFYTVGSGDRPVGKTVRHIGNLAYENTYGISVHNYHTISINCKYINNKTDVEVTDNENSSLTQY